VAAFFAVCFFGTGAAATWVLTATGRRAGRGESRAGAVEGAPGTAPPDAPDASGPESRTMEQ
jgi:hypothetical protein